MLAYWSLDLLSSEEERKVSRRRVGGKASGQMRILLVSQVRVLPFQEVVQRKPSQFAHHRVCDTNDDASYCACVRSSQVSYTCAFVSLLVRSLFTLVCASLEQPVLGDGKHAVVIAHHMSFLLT